MAEKNLFDSEAEEESEEDGGGDGSGSDSSEEEEEENGEEVEGLINDQSEEFGRESKGDNDDEEHEKRRRKKRGMTFEPVNRIIDLLVQIVPQIYWFKYCHRSLRWRYTGNHKSSVKCLLYIITGYCQKHMHHTF